MRLDFSKVPTDEEYYNCPDCGLRCRVFRVRKQGPRMGWGFIKCTNCRSSPGCPRFFWVDTTTKFTEEQRAAIKRDLNQLLGVCDGAYARDDSGFNAYDAKTARKVARDLDRGLAIDWDSLAKLLWKYRKTQLGGHDDY